MFELFLSGYSAVPHISRSKAVYKAKYESAKVAAESLRDVRARVDEARRLLLLEMEEADGQVVDSSASGSLRAQLSADRAEYQRLVDELKALKAEITEVGRVCQKAKIQSQKDFGTWHEWVLGIQQQAQAARGGLFYGHQPPVHPAGAAAAPIRHPAPDPLTPQASSAASSSAASLLAPANPRPGSSSVSVLTPSASRPSLSASTASLRSAAAGTARPSRPDRPSEQTGRSRDSELDDAILRILNGRKS
jgi:hypothetical protein